MQPQPAAAPAAAKEIPLHWQGEIVVGEGETIEFFVGLSKSEGSGYSALLDIPVQGARQLQVQDLHVDPDRVAFELVAAGAAWSWNPTASEPECAFVQQGRSLPCEVEAMAAGDYANATELPRPQTPKAPFPYEIREVEFDNQGAGIKLAGTLTIPEGDGPHPAALLISGSGAQDRDESIMGHKPFWVMADHLSRNGIAVLRVDDRGVGGSTGDPMTATSLDFAGDAVAGVAFLRSQADIDKARVGLIGHSEGGLIAPIVASRPENAIAFVVMLAGPGVPGSEILHRQAKLIAARSGASEEEIAQDAKLRGRLFDVLRREQDPEKAKPQLEALMREQLQVAGVEGPQADAAIEAQVATLNSPWYRFFLVHDPALVLAKLRKVPVLALGGTLDLQVDPEQNLPAIEKALKKARNKKSTVEKVEGLNHLFQHAKTGLMNEYPAIEETFAPEILERLAAWISSQTAPK